MIVAHLRTAALKTSCFLLSSRLNKLNIFDRRSRQIKAFCSYLCLLPLSKLDGRSDVMKPSSIGSCF